MCTILCILKYDFITFLKWGPVSQNSAHFVEEPGVKLEGAPENNKERKAARVVEAPEVMQQLAQVRTARF